MNDCGENSHVRFDASLLDQRVSWVMWPLMDGLVELGRRGVIHLSSSTPLQITSTQLDYLSTELPMPVLDAPTFSCFGYK